MMVNNTRHRNFFKASSYLEAFFIGVLERWEDYAKWFVK